MIKKILKGFLIVILTIIVAAAACVGYVVYDNSRVKNTEYTYSSRKVPESFNGYRISVVSDFHNGENGAKVISAAKKAEPDIIAITGDLINYDDTDYTNAVNLVKGLCEVAPVYYIYGNHEKWSLGTDKKANDPKIKDALADTGVTILDDKGIWLEKGESRIRLTGYADENYDDFSGHYKRFFKQTLDKLGNAASNGELSILLTHRAQYFDVVDDYPYDLVISGHLHGGLINLPRVREYILREHFGTDEYIKGEYTRGEKKMFISAGIAKEEDIYRILNTPEVMTVELKYE